MRRWVGAAALAGLLALGAMTATAQPAGHISCVLYRGYNGQVFVQGALCRSVNPNVWFETNTQNGGVAEFTVLTESPNAVVLRKADSLQLLINVSSGWAPPDTIDFRANDRAPWTRLYAITGVERR